MSARRDSASQRVMLRPGQDVDLAVRRGHEAGLAGIGEEADRRHRADEDQVLDAGEGGHRLVDRIRHPLDRRPSRAALDPPVAGLRQHPGTSGLGDPPRHAQRAPRVTRGRRAAGPWARPSGAPVPRPRRRGATRSAPGSPAAASPPRRPRPSTCPTAGSAWPCRQGPCGPPARRPPHPRPPSPHAPPVRTQHDTPRANPSVSAVSGASSGRWYVAWSPTRFTIGERARRALCRLASPFARPGPQCSRVQAGRSCMRA